MSPIQLHARLSDLIFTEPPIIPRKSFDKYDNVGYAFKAAAEETGCPNMNAAEYYPQFLKDLKYSINNEPNFAAHIHPNGIVGDGNFRGHWLRWAGLEFIPISLDYFLCNSNAKWLADHPYMGRGAAGKEQTILTLERHLKPGFDQWWMLEAREFLNPYIKWGPPPPEFNMSYEDCRARLKQ